jgi:hypothetical protein
MVGHQRNQADAVLHGVAGGDELADGRPDPRRHRVRIEAEIGRPHQLALAHRHAAGHLGETLPGADAHQQRLDLTESAAVDHPDGVARELANGLRVGGEPREAVGRALLALHQPHVGPATRGDALAHGDDGVAEQVSAAVRASSIRTIRSVPGSVHEPMRDMTAAPAWGAAVF